MTRDDTLRAVPEPRPVALPPAERTIGQLVSEDLGPLAALARAWQLARADFLHAFGALLALGALVFLTQAVLAFVLRGFGGVGVSIAFFLASIVVSPLLFVGMALLYGDQAARVKPVN